MLDLTFSAASTHSDFPQSMPTRQPGILKVLLSELSSNPTSLPPGRASKLVGKGFKIWL